MTLGYWWRGTRLVAGRAVAEAFASKTWRAVTVLMLLLGIASIVVPRLIGDSEVSYTLAQVEGADPSIGAALVSAGDAGGFDVVLLPVPDEAAAEAAVRDGEADAGLSVGPDGSVMFVAADSGGTFPALVSQAASASSATEAMREAGLSDAQIAGIASIPPPRQVAVGRVADEGRAGVGFVVGIVLYVSLIFTGQTIATAVATEKTTRITEVLLAVLKPSQLLVGTVAGVGLLGIVQIAALGVPVVVGIMIGGGLDLPPGAAADVVLGIGWYVLGLILYSFVFAALATLVGKVTEVGAVTMPINVVVIGSYLLAVIVTVNDPNSWPSVAASIFPLSAPMVMPMRWATGLVPIWQLLLSMALTAAAAVVLAAAASRVYARGMATTGRRLKLREVLSRS